MPSKFSFQKYKDANVHLKIYQNIFSEFNNFHKQMEDIEQSIGKKQKIFDRLILNEIKCT